MLPILETALGSLFKGIVDKFFPDKSESEKRRIAAEMAREAQQFELLKGQLDINKVEAANPDKFISGWRPFLGWVCGFGLAWAWVIMPIFNWLIVILGFPAPELPKFNTEELIAMCVSLLGLAGYRTVEKIKRRD